jgi:signal transduction histidine kinase
MSPAKNQILTFMNYQALDSKTSSPANMMRTNGRAAGLPWASRFASAFRRVSGCHSIASLRVWYFAGASIITLALWGLIAIQLVSVKREMLVTAFATGHSLVLSLAEQQNSRIRAIDLSLQYLREDWTRDPRTFGAAVDRHAAYLDGERIIQVAVVDKDGWMIFSRLPQTGPINFVDRDYFRVQKTRGVDALGISEPVLGRVTKQWAIQFTRPLFSPDKRFAGVVVMALPPPALEDLFETVSLGTGARITMVRSDGIIMARSGAQIQETGKRLIALPGSGEWDPPIGQYHASSPIDGVERVVAYRKLDSYPLTLYVAQSVDDVLTPFYKQRRTALAIGSIATALLCAVAWLLAAHATGLHERRKHELLREVDRHKTEFIATLSHELRDPLSAIRLSHSMLEQSPDLVAGDRFSIDVIGRQAAHLSSMVEDCLDMTRIEQGLIELRNERVDLRDVVTASVESVTALINQRQHNLEVNLPRESLCVIGDYHRLCQVIGNLLANSIRYTPDGGAIIVWLERCEAGNEQAIVRVRDNGIGIAVDQITRIFEPFTKAQVADGWRERKGLGLGLTLCRRLVQLHGGHLAASSEGLRKGTEMAVYLPLAG